MCTCRVYGPPPHEITRGAIEQPVRETKPHCFALRSVNRVLERPAKEGLVKLVNTLRFSLEELLCNFLALLLRAASDNDMASGLVNGFVELDSGRNL